ncbi:MAG: aldehyde dehydrogenase family protein [Candidatus Dormibacteraeota bacterium]|nr:aldehyde dehydrogenase family protein [Candidatus Dormibacteraeota bacterium]
MATAVEEAVRTETAQTYQIHVNGEWRDASSGETFPSVNPSNEEVIAHIAKGTREDAQAAIRAARDAFDRGLWSAKTFKQRSDIMLQAHRHLVEKSTADDWATKESMDAGVTLRLANLSHVPVALEHFRSLSAQAGEMKEYEPLPWVDMPAVAWNFVNRGPIGVAAQIVPWNFPLMMAVWKLAPALVTGNSVVIKPASLTSITALELVKALDETGLFPRGVINIVTGPGGVVGEELASNPMVDKVAFTGSTEVGRRIMQLASGTVKKVTLELGGKSANILLPDADLDLAIDGSLFATFMHQGQVCESGTRLLVHESIHDEVVERLVARTREIVIGDANDFETGLGPLVSEAQRATVEKYVEIGKSEGARVVVGGKRPEGLERGFFFEPTIFTDVTNDMRIAQEEIFGPVLSVIKYRDTGEAIRIANDSIYGLAGGIFSTDIPEAISVARKIRTGTMWINDWHLLNDVSPFGGFKQSGVGKELGMYGLTEYTIAQHIHVAQSTRRADRFIWDALLP